MSVHHICPRCKLPVAEERLRIVPFVCDSCGYTLSPPNGPRAGSQEKADSRVMIAIAGVLVFTFIILASSVELRWLQARDLIGLSSVSSLDRMVKVCTDLHKPDCVRAALTGLAKKNVRFSARLGEFLISQKKYKEAIASMRKFIASGKADAHSISVFATALAENNQMDEAARNFDRLIRVRNPSMEHVRSYVKYLTRAKRFDYALSVILRVRRHSVNALPVEYRVISEMRGAANNRVMASKR